MWSNATAQVTTSESTDFWVAFMDNADTTQGDHSLCIFASTTRHATLTATNPNIGWSVSLNTSPTNVNKLYIPLSQAFIASFGVVENKGIHIISTETITLYANTRGYPNQDYTNILPVHMLLNDYMVQTFPSNRFSSEFAIVAAEDSVTVNITLNSNTLDGHTLGEIYSIFLPVAGKMCQIKSTQPDDLSGTLVSALNGKKIAVFNGNVCAYIPNRTDGGSCDHVVEQALPIAYWVKKFVAIGSERNKNDYVRITSLENNRIIRINGNEVSTISAGNTFQYQMTSNSAADYIETTQPAMVYLYFSSLEGNGYGDSSMTTVPPIEQGIHQVKFPVENIGNISNHFT